MRNTDQAFLAGWREMQSLSENNQLDRRTGQEGSVEGKRISSGLANSDDPPGENETAASDWHRSGGKDLEKASRPSCLPYNHPERVAIRQETAARERLLRALVSFNALTLPEKRALAKHVTAFLSAGAPIPAFADIEDEAADWARFASRDELRAYLAAIVVRISSNERRKLAKALGKAAA